MATQASTIPVPLTRNNKKSSPGIIGQVITLVTRPIAFFREMPQNRQWLWVAVLILVIFGFAASNQGQTSTTTSSATQTAQGFDLSLLQLDTDTTSTAAAAVSSQTTSTAANTTLMTALLAACGVMVMWTGETALLCLIPMLRGYSPNIGRSLQIAVWASLPLALMLGLRQIYFATGGTGGAMGLSLLLDQWDGYSTLPEIVQRVLAVFTSNLSLFWLWSLVLLYFGARHALSGKRWLAALVLAMWIAGSTIVPAVVSEPVTTTAPLATTTAQPQSGNATTENTAAASQAGSTGMFPGGGFGGDMPSGGPGGGGMPPSGGGRPSGG